MKNKTKIQTLWVALVVLIVAVTYLWKNPRVVTKRVSNPAPPPPMFRVPPRQTFEQRREPESSGVPQSRNTNLDACSRWDYSPDQVTRPSPSTARRFVVAVIGTTTTRPRVVKTCTQSQ